VLIAGENQGDNRMKTRHLQGSCHCGNIQVSLEWPTSDAFPARACRCTFCRKHNAAWTSNPSGYFSLVIVDDLQVTRYRFGSKTADFHVCQTCGVIPVVTCVIDDARYAVFNVNILEGLDRSELLETTANFEGEGIDDRLSRRKRNWTPEVATKPVEVNRR
jgi:hypothetical protein